MKLINVFYLAIIISYNAIGQSHKLDSTFKFENYTGYVLTVNTAATRNVIGSTLNDYYEIREVCSNCLVTYICSEAGITQRDQSWYAANVLKFNPNEDLNTRVIFNDSLYHAFQNHKVMEQILYLKDGKISFRETLKHYSLREDTPHSADIKLKLMSSLKIPDGIHPSMVDMIRKHDGSSILYLSDLDEKVFKLSVATGEILSSFQAVEDFGIDFYCATITSDTLKCNYARKNQDKLKRLNRSELYFSDIRSNMGKITISSMLQVSEELNSDFIYRNELGLMDTLKKGSWFANGYSVLIELDNMLNLKNAYFLDNLESSDYAYEAGSDFSFLPLEAGYVVLNIPDEDALGERDPIYSLFTNKGEHVLQFSQYYKPVFPAETKDRFFEIEYGGLLQYKKKLYGYVDVLPFIYDLNTTQPVYTVAYSEEGLECEDNFAQYYEEYEESIARYRVMSISALDGNRIGVLFAFCDEVLVLDILTEDFALVNRIRVSDFIDFDPWLDSVGSNIVIEGNKMIILTKEFGQFYLKVFEVI